MSDQSQVSGSAQPEAAAAAPRPTISDGKCLRQIWRPTDGNGDGDIGVFESTRYTAQGHPTWKLYCGDLPASVKGVFCEPPRNVYLDDNACFRIFHFAGYNGAERGRRWRHDFDNKGNVKPHRKNRGRPALDSEGQICELKTGPSKVIRFGGAEDLRELELVRAELAAQAKGETLILPVPQPSGNKRNGTPYQKPAPKRQASANLLNGVNTAPPFIGVREDHDFGMSSNGVGRPMTLKDQTFAAVSTNSVSELRATVISLQDRARIMSDAVLELQRKNEYLELAKKSQEILYNRSQLELAEERKLNASLVAQLKAKNLTAGPSLSKDIDITLLNNKVVLYRSIASGLWAKQKATGQVLAKSARAADAIENLTETLMGTKGELKPLMEEHEDARQGLEDWEAQIKALLGDEFEEFEMKVAEFDRAG